MTQSAHDDQFITAEEATGCSVAADPTQERTGHTAAEQEAWFAGIGQGQANERHNASLRAASAEAAGEDTDSFDDPSALAAVADALAEDTSNDNAQFAAAYLYRQAKALIDAPAAGDALDAELERHIDGLRLKAFRTNAPDDRQAYFEAVSKWFQERDYRALRQERRLRSGACE